MRASIRASALAATCLLAGLATAADPEDITTVDGAYTETQADRGEDLYKINCRNCHDKRYFRPVLKRWEGKSLTTLYTIMSTAMPESNPGSLPRQDYVDILAYILSQSRYPAGENELTYKDDALEHVIVVPRK